MKKILIKFIISLIGLSFCLFTNLSAYEDGDWQAWITGSIEGDLTKNLKIKMEEEFRFGDNIREFYHHHTDCGLTYKLTGWFRLGLNYRQIYRKRKEVWKIESRPHVNLIFSFKLRDFNFKNRCRLEYRIREGERDTMRFRNKLTITPPIKWTKLEIQPYIADEVFVDLEKGKFNRNRLYAGLKFKLVKNLESDIFYLWQTDLKKDDWIDYNILGAKLKVKFK